MSHDISLLAQHYGLGESWYDHRGEFRYFSDAARCAILEHMGCDLNSEPAAIDADALPPAKMLPAVIVCEEQHVVVSVNVPEATHFNWQLTLEDGEVRRGSGEHRSLSFSGLPQGYHTLEVTAAAASQRSKLIVTPVQCFQPTNISSGQRLWGLSIQLYTLRTSRNWGMGDFADLCQLAEQAAPHGCALIGLNPLHALRPADAAHISPYSPSSRRFLNVLYIAVDALPEFKMPSLQKWFREHEGQLKALRESEVVQYTLVASLKLAALRLCHAELAHDVARQHDFTVFVKQGGDALRSHALYDALDMHFSGSAHRWGWRSWPQEYHDPASKKVQAFANTHSPEVEFFLYLQWLAATQWRQAQQAALKAGMSLGMYGDVAVGVDPNGSEIWSQRALYVDGVSVGAPPDPLALKGQDWGIPPQHPLQLRDQAYEPFIQMLRANMQACGALRIDHVMALCRLWWVPRGFEATDGVYVHYPLSDLARIVALESVRNRCLVIGEDLGTVPDAMRDAMARHLLFHYKVLFFEKAHDGEFIAPEHYPRHALAVVTTHDLPPFRSWWESEDIALRQQLNLYPDDAVREQVQRERHNDRRALMRALSRAGLWHWQVHEALPPYSFELMRAAYLYAGLSQAALLVVQPEDLLGMNDPVNIPGTSVEHANWQRKLSEDLGPLLLQPKVSELMRALGRARHNENPNV